MPGVMSLRRSLLIPAFFSRDDNSPRSLPGATWNDSRGASAAPPDWRPFFAAAGLDYARFSPAAPKWVPEGPFDARADWEGSGASQTDSVHVAGASWHGKPVWFAVIYPWSVPERAIETSKESVEVLEKAIGMGNPSEAIESGPEPGVRR